jgi:hypothetical protein
MRVEGGVLGGDLCGAPGPWLSVSGHDRQQRQHGDGRAQQAAQAQGQQHIGQQ